MREEKMGENVRQNDNKIKRIQKNIKPLYKQYIPHSIKIQRSDEVRGK